jgi:hypothetical protein
MSCVEIRTTTVLRDGDMHALKDLDRVWGCAYDLAVTRCHWVAYGLRTGHWLVASCAVDLRRLIVADAAVHSCVF